MGGLCPVPQPFVVAFSMRFWVLYNGIAVLNADGIIQPPDRAGTAPEVSEFPVTVQILKGTHRSFDALDDKEYEGSLIYLLQSGCEFIRNNSKVRFAKEAQYRVDKPDYAQRAVTEAVDHSIVN